MVMTSGRRRLKLFDERLGNIGRDLERIYFLLLNFIRAA